MNEENNNIISTEELNPNAEVLDVAVTPEDKFAGLQSDVEASIASNQSFLDTQKKKQEDAEVDIVNLLTGNTEAEQERVRLLEEAGVSDKEARLTNLASSIEAEQRFLLPQEKLQKENEAIDSGVTRSFLNRGISRSERDSAVRQLGLAAEASVLMGDIATAKSRIKTAIDAKFGDQEGLLEARKFQLSRLDNAVSEGKVALREDQKKKFDLQKEDIDRELKEIETNKAQILDVAGAAATNGAPARVLEAISNAKTPMEAMQAAGRYNVSIADRIRQMEASQVMQTSSGGNLSNKDREKVLKNKTAQEAASLISVNRLLGDYENLIKSFGKTPTKRQQREANAFITNNVAPALAVANGQGAMTDDERAGILDDIGIKQIGRREKVTLGNVARVRSGLNTSINTRFDFIDSAIPGASEEFEMFKDYRVSQLPPAERATVLRGDAIAEMKNSGFDDSEILEFYVGSDNIDTATQLYQQGYNIDEIISNLTTQ